jgi:hypothetical protein
VNKTIGIALVVVGVVLIALGFSASESFTSEFSEFFTGAPTNKAIWLFVGGVVALIVGLGGTLISARRGG